MAVVDDNMYKPNSYKARAEAEEKKIEKGIKGSAVKHKKTVGEKLKDIFIGEDVDNVGEYIVFDVVAPAIKEMISEAISSGVNMMLFGDAGRGRRSSSNRDRVSYTDYARTRNREIARRARFDFTDIEFEDMGDAADALDMLEDTIIKYGAARVSDFYSFAGVTGSPTDNDWGWTNIGSARPVRLRNGNCILDLPRPKPLR